jgi:hypothetical protein
MTAAGSASTSVSRTSLRTDDGSARLRNRLTGLRLDGRRGANHPLEVPIWTSSPLLSKATRQDGTVKRLDAEGGSAPMSGIDLAEAAKRIAGDVEIAEQALISGEDAYYLQDSERFVLPVYRVVLKDDESTRYYIDPRSGALLQRTDATARWYRWLFGSLHRIDFTAGMRARPAWDIIMLTLMLGGLALTTTGFYLALRRIRNDIMLLFRFIDRRKPAPAERGDSVGVDGRAA